MLQMINSQTLDPAIDVDSDFSPDGYRRLMQKIRQQGYQFCDLQTAENGHLAASHHIFLRHDIDINLESAFQIACIEFELGIRSTYFICVRSPFYNPFSATNRQFIHNIHELGHCIAPHVVFDADVCFFETLNSDIITLSAHYPFVNKELVSVHSPANFECVMDMLHIPGIAKVYAPIADGAVKYISDSGGRWRNGGLLHSAAFLQKKNIQLLTHPIWWTLTGEQPKDKIQNLLRKKSILVNPEHRKFLPKLFARLEKSGS
ncbi:MAG: hypothetical protein KDH98_09190 [Calditrichaeota bacterium]|nr:hypothetical protein [Calditrichota bacterium]